MDNNHVKHRQTKLKKQGHTTTFIKLKHTTENIINQMQTSLHNYIKNYKANSLSISISTGTKHSNDNSGIYFIKARQPITTCSSRNNLLSPIPIIIENQQYKNKYTTLHKLNAERTAVSLRRMQYAHEIKNVKYNHKYKGKVNQIVHIQLWWKYLYKVIRIQSIIRGSLFRKKLFVILNKQNRVIHGLIKIKDVIVKRVGLYMFNYVIHPYHVVMKLCKLIMKIRNKNMKVCFWKWFMCYLHYTQFNNNKKGDMDEAITTYRNGSMSFCKDSDRDNNISLSFQNEIINTNLLFGNNSNSNCNGSSEIKTKTERTVVAVKLNKHKGKVYENKLNAFINNDKKMFYIQQEPDTKFINTIKSNVLLSQCLNNIYKVCMLKICVNKQRIRKIIKSYFIKWKQLRMMFIIIKQNDVPYIKPNHSFVFKKPKITKHYNNNNYNTNNVNMKRRINISTHSAFIKWYLHLQSKTYSNKSISISTIFILYILQKLIKYKQHQQQQQQRALYIVKVYKKEIIKKWFHIWKQHHNINSCIIDSKRSSYTKKHHFSLSAKNIFNIPPPPTTTTTTTTTTDVNSVIVDVTKHNATNIKAQCNNHKKNTTNIPSIKECDDVYISYNTNTNSTNITSLTDSFMQNVPYIKSKVINFSKK